MQELGWCAGFSAARCSRGHNVLQVSSDQRAPAARPGQRERDQDPSQAERQSRWEWGRERECDSEKRRRETERAGQKTKVTGIEFSMDSHVSACFWSLVYQAVLQDGYSGPSSWFTARDNKDLSPEKVRVLS